MGSQTSYCQFKFAGPARDTPVHRPHPASTAAPAGVISQPERLRVARPISVRALASAMFTNGTALPSFFKLKFRRAVVWPSVRRSIPKRYMIGGLVTH